MIVLTLMVMMRLTVNIMITMKLMMIRNRFMLIICRILTSLAVVHGGDGSVDEMSLFLRGAIVI